MNAQRLRDLRTRRVLTLRELEKKSGVSLNTIYKLEHDRSGAHPSTIRKLAAALEVKPEELVSSG